ncbi:MAG TPA: FG-GAP-like repeat-containing protein [Dongiaceae bacterium]|nr:FG-GAP-like repeat-containing protein [Dongiaceae bacterium]
MASFRTAFSSRFATWMKRKPAWKRVGLQEAWLALALACSLADPVSAAGTVETVAGGTHASFAVSRDGAATYSIPLMVPPGTAGAQPSLGLVYNSLQGDGVAGVGWSLSGTGTITRCNATQAIDGFVGGVNYNADDRFCLDGRRLVQVSSAGEFRTVVDSYVKITAPGGMQACGSGPCSFLVQNPDGSSEEFGASTDSRILAQNRTDGSVATWAITSRTDANGNSIAFTYDTSQLAQTGAYYLSSINYTANATAPSPLQAGRSVLFGYAAAPGYATQYSNGGAFSWKQVLSSVTTQVNGNTVKIYNLAYETGATTGHKRISSITECDGNGQCLAPTSFTYEDEGASPGQFTAETPTALGSGANSSTQQIAGDFNGDGLTDLILLAPSGTMTQATLYLRTSNGFKAMPLGGLGTWYNQSTLLTGDFNGDGVTDLAQIYKSGTMAMVRGYLSTSNGLTPANWKQPLGPWPNQGLFTTGDFNGDGLVDLASIAPQNNNLAITSFQSTGSGFTTVAWQGLNLPWEGGFLLPGNYTSNPVTSIAYVRPSNGSLAIDVIALNGSQAVTSHWVPAGSAGNWVEDPVFLAGDFNGDGLSDIGFAYPDQGQISFNAFLSSGTSFQNTPLGQRIQSLNNLGQIYAADVNGDGKSDLVISSSAAGNMAFTVWENRPSPSGLSLVNPGLALSIPGSFTNNNFMIGNFSGLGYSDVLQLSNSAGSLSASAYVLEPYEPHAGKPAGLPDMLAQVEDGLGVTTMYNYAPLTNVLGPVYTRGSGATYPLQDVQNSTYVVAAQTVSDGLQHSYKLSYTYSDARIDVANWGWLGFGSVKTINAAAGITEERSYAQNFPFIGQVTGRLVEAAQNSEPLQEVQVKLACETGTGTASALAKGCQQLSQTSASGQPQYFKNVFQVVATTSLEQLYQEGTSSPASSITHTYTYDGYGNLLSRSDQAVAASGTSALQYCQAIGNNDSNGAWRLGLVTNAKTTSASSCSNMTSWDATQDLRWSTYGYDGHGNLSYSQNWLAQANATSAATGCGTLLPSGGHWLCTQFSYDAYGNVTVQVDPNGNMSQISYDSTYQTFPTKATPPAVPSGANLAVTMSYEPAFGSLTELTDPNGHNYMTSIDSFGRLTATYGPNPAGGNATQLTAVSYAVPTGGAGLSQNIAICASWQECAGNMPQSWYSMSKLTDGLGRPYRTMETLPASATPPAGLCAPAQNQTILSDIGYDEAGRLNNWTMPYFQGQSTTSAYSLTYDPYQRPQQLVAPDGTTLSLGYDLTSWQSILSVSGQPSSGQQATTATQKSTTQLDPWRRPLKVTAPDGGVTTYVRDPLGEATQITDPIGVRVSYTWDSLGRLVSYAHPDLGTTTYGYDNNSNLISLTDGLGQTTSLTYDSLNRLTSRKVAAANGTVALSVTYGYDAQTSGAFTIANGLGQLTSVTDQSTTYVFSYDPYERPQNQWVSLSGYAKPFAFAWTYGPQSQVTSFTYPDGTTLANSYGRDQTLCTVALSPAGSTGSQIYASYSNYTASKQPQNVSYLNGVTSAYSYDATLRPLSQDTGSAGGPPLIDTSYVWGQNANSPAGLLTQLNDKAAQGQSQSFGYDLMGRLTSAQGAYGSASYGYNAGGAITRQNTTAFTYPAQPSYRPSAATSTAAPNAVLETFSFDAIGNLASATPATPGPNAPSLGYVFDPAGRLQSVTRSGQSAPTAMSYDPFDQRLSKTDPDGTKTLYVGPNYTLTVLPNGDGLTTKSIPGLNGDPVAEITVPFGASQSSGQQ